MILYEYMYFFLWSFTGFSMVFLGFQRVLGVSFSMGFKGFLEFSISFRAFIDGLGSLVILVHLPRGFLC